MFTRWFLEHKAEVDVKDKYGNTALHWATMYRHKAVARLLLGHETDVDARPVVLMF